MQITLLFIKCLRWNFFFRFFNVLISGLTFIHDGDGLLRDGRARSPDCFGIQIKLVARAVLEVGQSD